MSPATVSHFAWRTTVACPPRPAIFFPATAPYPRFRTAPVVLAACLFLSYLSFCSPPLLAAAPAQPATGELIPIQLTLDMYWRNAPHGGLVKSGDLHTEVSGFLKLTQKEKIDYGGEEQWYEPVDVKGQTRFGNVLRTTSHGACANQVAKTSRGSTLYDRFMSLQEAGDMPVFQFHNFDDLAALQGETAGLLNMVTYTGKHADLLRLQTAASNPQAVLDLLFADTKSSSSHNVFSQLTFLPPPVLVSGEERGAPAAGADCGPMGPAQDAFGPTVGITIGNIPMTADGRPGAGSCSGTVNDIGNFTLGIDAQSCEQISAVPPGDVSYVVQWSFGARKAGKNLVTIDGPDCGCMDAEQEGPGQFTFTATAGHPGGEFSPFEIDTGSGEEPRIVKNSGGNNATLVLAADKTSGGTTIKTTYTRDGASETHSHTVDFCALDAIALADDLTDFSFTDGASPTLEIQAETGPAWFNGEAVEENSLHWQLDEMSGGTRTEIVSDKGLKASFVYRGLPLSNQSFGPRDLSLKIAGKDCDCKRTRQIRTFFPPLAKNHPGPGQGETANWFHYWGQTNAGRPYRPRYVPDLVSCDGRPAAGRYDWDKDAIFLSDNILKFNCTRRPDGTSAEWLDCYAETLRHEITHQKELKAWWGPLGMRPPICPDSLTQVASIAAKVLTGIDSDMDLVPDYVEKQLQDSRGCSHVSPRSCSGRPANVSGAGVKDLEMNAYQAGWSWVLGSATKEDWSCDGHQWTGGSCP